MRINLFSVCIVAGLIAVSLSLPDCVAARELAPGFEDCMQKARDDSEISQCYSSAEDYWDKILENIYKKAVNKIDRSSDSQEEKFRKKRDLQKFRWTFGRYSEEMSRFIGSESTEWSRLRIEETKRMVVRLNQWVLRK